MSSYRLKTKATKRVNADASISSSEESSSDDETSWSRRPKNQRQHVSRKVDRFQARQYCLSNKYDTVEPLRLARERISPATPPVGNYFQQNSDYKRVALDCVSCTDPIPIPPSAYSFEPCFGMTNEQSGRFLHNSGDLCGGIFSSTPPIMGDHTSFSEDENDRLIYVNQSNFEFPRDEMFFLEL